MPSRAEALAALRAARQSGKTNFDTYQVKEETSLYETVDEDSYKKIVRKRLDEDDFVVDDNGEGYADDGREDWQDERREDSESEEELPSKSKAGMSILSSLSSPSTLTSRSQAEKGTRRSHRGQDQQRNLKILQQRTVQPHRSETQASQVC